MNVVGEKLTGDVTFGDGAVDVWDDEFLPVIPQEYFHVDLLFGRSSVQDELRLVHSLLQLHLLDSLSVWRFPVTSHQFCWEVICRRVHNCEFFLPGRRGNVDLGQVLTCEVCDKFRFREFVPDHIINQVRWQFLPICQTTGQYGDAQFPGIERIIDFNYQLWVGKIFWWVLDELLIGDASFVEFGQNVLPPLLPFQCTLAQRDVEHGLLRRLLSLIQLLLDLL